MSTLIKPTIHLNGSSPKDLARHYEAAIEAVWAARNAHMLSAPNGRDYYPQGVDAYKIACEEHSARAKKLLEVQEELAELLEHVQTEIDKRKR